MKRLNDVVDVVRVEIEYGVELENYEERLYTINTADKLQDVMINIYTELKNDFSKYAIDEVEFSVYGLVNTNNGLMGKCYGQTWEDVLNEYLRLKPWF